MQGDLISRSAVLETINEVDISDCTDIESIIDRVYAEVASVPAVDAVPVVRCKDCKFRGDIFYCPMTINVNCGIGKRFVDGTADNDFCFRGARTDEKEND